MTTTDLIREHLGDRWWEREHDGTAILAVLDRIREVCSLSGQGTCVTMLAGIAADEGELESRDPDTRANTFRRWIGIADRVLPGWRES